MQLCNSHLCFTFCLASDATVYDTQCNNYCESFKLLKKARSEPLLSMLESIRQYLRDRFTRKKRRFQMWAHDIGHNIMMDEYRVNLDQSRNWQASHVGGNIFEVIVGSNERVAVNLNEKSCTYRRWRLSVIPCKHAISCILHQV